MCLPSALHPRWPERAHALYTGTGHTVSPANIINSPFSKFLNFEILSGGTEYTEKWKFNGTDYETVLNKKNSAYSINFNRPEAYPIQKDYCFPKQSFTSNFEAFPWFQFESILRNRNKLKFIDKNWLFIPLKFSNPLS